MPMHAARSAAAFRPRRALALALGVGLLAACQGPAQKAAQPPAEPISSAPQHAPRENAELDQIVVTGARVNPAEAARLAPLVAPPPPPAPSPMSAPVTNRENYAEIDRNGILRVAEQPVSTFSIDVDTGAYSNLRRMLHAGQRPPSDAVRIEELINYFSYDYPKPRAGEAPFAFATELAPSPFHDKRLLLQVALQAQAVEAGGGLPCARARANVERPLCRCAATAGRSCTS